MHCPESFQLSSIELRSIDLKCNEGGLLLTALRDDAYNEIDGVCIRVHGRLDDGNEVLLGRGRGYEYEEYLIMCDSYLRGNIRGYGLLQLMYIIRVLVDRMHRQTLPENIIFPAGLFDQRYDLLYKRYWMRPVERHEAARMPPLLKGIYERSLKTHKVPGLYCLGRRGLHRLFFEADCLVTTGCLRQEDGQTMKLPVWPFLSEQIRLIVRDYDPILTERRCA